MRKRRRRTTCPRQLCTAKVPEIYHIALRASPGLLRIRARLSGRVKQPVACVERLNRMTPYAFRRSPCRMELLDAMTIHVLVNGAG